jgi:adenine-specific DNA-methyltransferase
MSKIPEPKKNELPSGYAYRLAQYAFNNSSQLKMRGLGQYFTPASTAAFMASFINYKPASGKLRILDPGCGTAVLACALIEEIVSNHALAEIELNCMETDPEITPLALTSLNYLASWRNERGAHVICNYSESDFIIQNKEIFIDKKTAESRYDIIIANPPYFKLSANDERLPLGRNIFNGQVNIYTLFIYASAKLLNTNGQLLFLIPAGFCGGGFYREFREELFRHIALLKIHIFPTSRNIFDESGELSSSIMLLAQRKTAPPEEYEIEISRAGGNNESEKHITKFVYNTHRNIIPLAFNHEEDKLLAEAEEWHGSFEKLGLGIFRGQFTLDDIKAFSPSSPANENEFAPYVTWRKNRSAENIPVIPATLPLLAENKNYILLRRYNKVEREKKISAEPYFCAPPHRFIGIDKQLLCVYKKSGEFSREEITLLARLLNSAKINTYLRIIFGNINLSVEDLSEIRFPENLIF